MSGYFLFRSEVKIEKKDYQPQQDYKNVTYIIEGQPVALVNGVAETLFAPDSATKITTRYFGNDIVKDVNGDGKDDVTFLLTQETGGSGTFFYVVMAIKTEAGYVGSGGLFLGDRIAPQSIASGPDLSVVVNFAEHGDDEGYASEPTVAKSIWINFNPETQNVEELEQDFTDEVDDTVSKIKADMFVGELEEVNTGCFADGECYVVIDGKHVTILVGRRQEVVGELQGIASIGDLESHIGDKLQVYAQVNIDGTYSLYGNEGFYIKLIATNSEL